MQALSIIHCMKRFILFLFVGYVIEVAHKHFNNIRSDSSRLILYLCQLFEMGELSFSINSSN